MMLEQMSFVGWGADHPSSENVVKSYSFDNSEIIQSILKLHVPKHTIDCDPTYSKGIFYKNSGVQEPRLKFDIFPQTDDTVQSDFRHLPIENGSVDCLMFDPPFVISNGPSLDDCPDGSNIIHNRFSSFKNPQELFGCYYDALTVGIDFTARDLQREARSKGLPWEMCKGFDGSAAIGEWVDMSNVSDIQDVHFHLDINGRTVQEGCTGDMLYKVDELISYISQFFTLKTGDLLYTGTPVGVGPVKIDDHLEGWLEERKVLEFNCK